MTPLEWAVIGTFWVLVVLTLIARNAYLWRLGINMKTLRKRQRLLRKVQAAMKVNRGD